MWLELLRKRYFSKVTKVIEYISGIASGSLAVMRVSLPEMKPNPEMERLRIPTTL